MLEPDGPKRSLHSSFQTVLLRNPAANMLTGAVTLFLKVSLKEGQIGFKPHLKLTNLVQAHHFMDEKTDEVYGSGVGGVFLKNHQWVSDGSTVGHSSGL